MYRTTAFALFLLLASFTSWGEAPPARSQPARSQPAQTRPGQPQSHQAPHAHSTAAIDRYLESEMRRQNIPGISLAVVKNGRPLYVKSYGVATLEHDVRTKPQTVFQIGSVGKQFTAVAVMMLASEQKLDLDDPLSKYLPEVPPSWGKVTLRLMLNHQSGIPRFTTPERQLLDLVHDYTDSELIQLASSQPLDFEPGTDVSYSDTGYVLLGFVINRVAGMFYGDFLQQRVFGPLGMKQTRVISDKDIVRNRASGYEKAESRALYNQTYVSPALNRTADGSLYSTVLDLMKWDRALYGDTVLPQATLERMWRIDPHRNGQRPLYHFGYGWENNRLRDQRLVEYDGNWQGFQAVMSRYVDKKLSIILLTNLSLCRTLRLGHTVAGLVDPDLTPYPESIADSDPGKTAEFRAFLDKIAKDGEYPDRLSTAAAARLVPSTMNTLRRDLRERGPILKLSLAEQRGGGAARRVYRVEEKDMVEFYTVSYSRDSRIDDIDLLSEY
jgi:CubicO group peptidase (beta-lactamase class C family)